MFNKIKNVFFQILGYTVILMIVSYLFKNTIYLDDSYYGMWCFIASLIIYILNKTVKPFLVWLTIPITGITLGLFYPFINLGILKLVSLILGGHFKIYGIWFAVLASILISILNVIFDEVIMKRVNRKSEN
ncbi:MAG: phage holin family protein [Bacilli bacterium]|nr:phage holin family protein [Bacilli bacterium]